MRPGRAGVLRGKRWAEALLEALASPPRENVDWMETHTRVIKSDAYSRVGLLELAGESSYLKYYRQKSILQQWWFWLGRGRGVQAFDRAGQLAAAGIRVPEARACLLVPGGMLLLTQGLPQARDLKALWQSQPSEQTLTEVLGMASCTLADLHRAGFAHGDCKWSNLLWWDDSVYLVDLEAVTRASPGDAAQARDLARFTVNAEDLGVGQEQYFVFLDAYCQAMEMPREAVVDRLHGDLQRYRARHREKYGERGAPLL